jgi:hypothetical protein
MAASPMPNVDHREMCRFDNRYGAAYLMVVGTLQEIRDSLLERRIPSHTQGSEEV